ncbi:MAG: hypothetical protein ACREJB_02810, partial [Planctomycetaceae bacterium]
MQRRAVVCWAVSVWSATVLTAGEITPPVSERFAETEADEAPDFRRHVVPLLGRLGCNGRACHGSFQGQNGFRLSLFGYNFAADHEALTGGEEPRINLAEPPASLVLQKPTLAIDHGGGERFGPDGWEARLLLRWIEAGAPGVGETDAHLVTLSVEPSEILFEAVGESVPLKLIAEWSDGSREDVTPLCRFRTNDESIDTDGESGVVTAAGKGDTHIIAFYDNGIVPVAAMLAYSSAPPLRKGGVVITEPGRAAPVRADTA